MKNGVKMVSKGNKMEKQCRDIVAENIRHLRKERLLTQEELAFRSELTPSYISKIERKKENISLGSLEKVANALNVSCYRLLMEAVQRKAFKSHVSDELTALFKSLQKEDAALLLKINRAIVRRLMLR